MEWRIGDGWGFAKTAFDGQGDIIINPEAFNGESRTGAGGEAKLGRDSTHFKEEGAIAVAKANEIGEELLIRRIPQHFVIAAPGRFQGSRAHPRAAQQDG